MTTDDETEAQLGAVFDELVELIGETKQASWTASSADRRRVFDDLKAFLAEQAGQVDDAELRLGSRAPWIASPTGHATKNIAGEADGDAERLVMLLVRDLRDVIDDIRRRAAVVEAEWRSLLSGVADNLELHVNALEVSMG